MAEYYRVKEPFAYGNNVATVGQIWADDNPAFKGREQFFEPIADAVSRVQGATETATAAPGEVRSIAKKSPRKVLSKPPVDYTNDDDKKDEV